jgi:hypothetical protein
MGASGQSADRLVPDGPGFWRGLLEAVLNTIRLVLTTLFALATRPLDFFRGYFEWAGTRFLDPRAKGDAAPFPYLTPFALLGYAIAVASAVLPLTQVAMIDMARQNPEMFGPGFAGLLESLRDIDPAAEAAKAGATYIDFAALTGIPFVDSAIGDAVQFAAYMLFGMVLWRLAPRPVTAKAVAHSLAYLVALVIFAQTIVHMLLGCLQLAAGIGVQAFMVAEALTSLVFGLYLLAMPALVLSEIFGVERMKMAKATLWAFGIWFVAGVALDLILNASGIWIRNFGLHLRL